MVYNINFFLIFLILKTFGETLINVYDFVILKIWFDSCITYLEQFLKFNVLINILGSKSWTRLSDFTFTFHFHALENEMATHSSVLVWRIPGTGEPGGLQSMGSQSQRRLSDFTFTFHFHALENEMATHSSVLAWRIPGTGGPGGLLSMGSHRVRHD